MSTTLIDLSMSVDNGMLTFPRIVQPMLEIYQSWEDYATQIGAAAYGVTWLTATYCVELSDHVGTHMDSLRHLGDHYPGAEGIPLEYCYGEGVVPDFQHKERGSGISSEEVQLALEKIAYRLKPLDIVLIMNGAARVVTRMSSGT